MFAQPVILLACQVFAEMVKSHLANLPIDSVTFLDYGLHAVPKNLKTTLQTYLDALPTPSLVILGYGLCGNGLANLQAGSHTLIVPKAEDCIALLLGSRQRYRQEFESQPATYYLTAGWLAVGSDPLGQFETLSGKYDPETVQWLMNQQFQHYRRLVFVARSASDLETHRPRALQVAEYCRQWGMEYEEVSGNDQFLRQLLETARSQSSTSEQFIVIQPGESLSPAHFMD